MKLAAHYNRANIVIMLFVLIVGAVIYYFAINYIANQQLDDSLREETEEANDFIRLNKRLPGRYELEEQQNFFSKTTDAHLPVRYFDTIFKDGGTVEPGRAERSVVTLNGAYYKATIVVSRENTESFLNLIAGITLLLAVGLLFILFLANRYFLNDLWKPFYKTLNSMMAFNVEEHNKPEPQQDKVEEFNNLNAVFRQMSVRVKTDFQHLKQFTEDASHEMLTPLAIISSKTDRLMQNVSFTEEQLEQLTDVHIAANKLSKLSQSLLLLVKIENNLIHDDEVMPLEQLISEKLEHFQDLFAAKNISVEKQLHPKQIKASRYLTDILLNNLFSNAIRHNVENGRLYISLSGNRLIFSNTGNGESLNNEAIFERFNKGQASSGTGLGLAIVKNICNLYHWTIDYRFDADMHSFEIGFPA